MYPFNCNLASLLKWNKCEVCLSIIHQVKVLTSSQNAVLHQGLCHRFVNCSCLVGMHYIHLVYVLLLSGVEPASQKLFRYLWVIHVHRKLPAVAVLGFYVYIYMCVSYRICIASGEWLLRWVHTRNITAYRNTVTLQETDTIRSYELNFHPVPHGVTVSCERYTLAFPVCYESPSDVFAASSGRWWRVTPPVHTCSGRNRTIPLMRRPNTDSTPNKPIT